MADVGAVHREIWLNPGGKQLREVTTPNYGRRRTQDGGAEIHQYRSRHQGIRANFVHLPMVCHYCPVKYFVKIGKSIDISGIEGVRPKNDLNGKRGKLGQKRVGDRGGIMVDYGG